MLVLCWGHLLVHAYAHRCTCAHGSRSRRIAKGRPPAFPGLSSSGRRYYDSSLRTCVYCIWRTLGYTISAALSRRLGYGKHGEHGER